MLVESDGRANIPRGIKPLEEFRVDLQVRAPGQAGAHLLELDLVQEQVAWFKSKGSKTTIISVWVDRPRRPFMQTFRHVSRRFLKRATSKVSASPIMEMYCVPKEEVAAVLADAGARIVDIRADQFADQHFLSYSYFVTK